MAKKRIIIGVSGASGVILGIKLLDYFSDKAAFETHLTWGNQAKKILSIETGYDYKQVENLADYAYSEDCLTAPIASGSFITSGMVVIPCSMSALGAISNATPYNLLTRAADVCLKEKRKLILVPRESPLHAGHLKNMYNAAIYGSIILPPIPAFYNKPASCEDMINFTIARILDQFEIEHNLCKRWGEE